jgi:trehalose 6-phosphate synthase
MPMPGGAPAATGDGQAAGPGPDAPDGGADPRGAGPDGAQAADGPAARPRRAGRLIVVSNRIPREDDVPAGGLVFALHDALSETGGLWIGAADPTREAPDGLQEIGKGSGGAYTRKLFSLTEAEHRGYYLGYANSVLWPLFHHRSDLLSFEDGDFEAYAAVNARVARAIAAEAGPDDLIWIHDYHFLTVAHELRKLGVENRVGIFLHIPFPSSSEVMALPQAEMLGEWFAAHDLVGLQAMRDVAAMMEVLRRDPKVQFPSDAMLLRDGRRFEVRSFPIGIDAEGFAEVARTAVIPRLTLNRDAPLLIGVDRLDYSKGLVHRFEAYGEYLSMRDSEEQRPTYLQIAPVSRGDVDAYREIREELERAAGAINGAHADLDWVPLRYVARHIPRDTIAGLYRRAAVALVTPLADGMNLVAKEFVAAQDPGDPGVLILSHFAGAAEQMGEALLVNPFDSRSTARAIDEALHMPLDERQARHAKLAEVVFEKDIAWWRRTYLDCLRAP